MSTELEGGFRLHHFQSDVQAGKTQNISASKLDANFQLLKPRKISGGLKHYTVNQETEGWDLKIFPQWPSVASILAFGPQLKWTPVADIKPSQSNPITGFNIIEPRAISPGPETSVFITQTSEAMWSEGGDPGALFYISPVGTPAWSEPPPSGAPQWIQVERCDGQRMYVWGTEWAAPA
jgi:hypothetical protein